MANHTIDAESVKKIKSLLELCNIAKIDRMIIDADGIRGINADKNLLVLADQHSPLYPNLHGLTLCVIGRIQTLQSRISMAGDEFELIAVTNDANPADIESLRINSKLIKTTFKASNSALATNNIPRNVKAVYQWDVHLTPDVIAAFNTAQSQTGGKLASLISRSSGVTMDFVSKDSEDIITVNVADSVDWVGEGDTPADSTFVHNYNVKNLIPLLKQAATGDSHVVFTVSAVGVSTFTLSGVQMIVVPQKNMNQG